MKCWSALRAVFQGTLLLFSIATMTGEGQAQASPSLASAPSSDAAGAPALPLWAYPVLPPPSSRPAGAPGPRPMAAPDETPRRVPGSSQTYTRAYIGDAFTVPDWFPNEHPPMPTPVREGKRPDARACGYCHLPNGLGRPENESIAGLPKAYIIEQLKDFREGSRHSSEPRMDSVNHMVLAAKAATPHEVEAAADYFSQLKLTKWIRVVETNTAPKTRIVGGMLVAEANGTEPIGSRIIEVSEDYEQTELRNPKSGFIAYVPEGNLKTGEALVKTGGDGKTIACTICHGPNLQGVGDTPGIAGRSPSQMTRQLIDFGNGTRNGPGAAMMKPPASSLIDEDIVAITAYLASLEP
jgi:cytochrome c553